jgi:hypothetical protein
MASASAATSEMTVERYAEIGAFLRYFRRDERDQVLAHFGLGPAAWDEARARWVAKIKESTAGDGVLVNQWNTAFQAVWERLQRDQPIIDSLGKGSTAPATPSHAEPEAPAPPVEAGGKALPSFLLPREPDRPTYAIPITSAEAEAPRRAGLRTTLPAIPKAPGVATMPFVPGATPPREPGDPIDSLERFAALAAELEAFPSAQGATWKKFGVVSAAARDTLHDAWKARLGADPALHAEWRRRKSELVQLLRRGAL